MDQQSASSSRLDGRGLGELRPITFERDFTLMSMGSVLASFGKTKVLCTASIEESVPRWLKGQNRGWVTAEYSLLPGSSFDRVRREAEAGKQSGRTMEIQRLIGRSLRAVCDLTALGERQVTLDCDVLQADGGTRTASISGAYLALHDALERLILERKLKVNPIQVGVAAISVGIVKAIPMLDLDYMEDSRAEVDMNVVMNSKGEFLEIQGTAESAPFSNQQLEEMLSLAKAGIIQIQKFQKDLLLDPPNRRERAGY